MSRHFSWDRASALLFFLLALLVAAPKSMTRAQFVAEERQAWTETRKQLDAVLTPDQLLHGRFVVLRRGKKSLAAGVVDGSGTPS